MACALRVGLTGGIGSGKSEAAHEFARLGATVIDTDIIARELVEPGQPALTEITDRFGADLLDASGRLDRTRLRQRVFADPEKRRQLEAILHPKIRDRALVLAEQAQTPYCILVIPLLLESGDDYHLDRVLVIDCPVDLQRRRTRQRDALPKPELDAILAAQASRQRRLAVADDVIVNDAGLDKLAARVTHLHQAYSQLAKHKQ